MVYSMYLVTQFVTLKGQIIAMNEIVERLRIFMQYKGIGVPQLAEALRYKHPQKLYRLFNTEGARPSVQLITDISYAFPDLNLDWLFKGSGSMNDNGETVNFQEKYHQCLEEKDELWKQILKLNT